MTDKEQVARIAKMNEEQLFDYVMTNPEFLTDSYYRVLGDAIRARYKEITP